MKKYITICLLLLFAGIVVVADDDVFMEHLKDCSRYSSSGTVNAEGNNATTHKSIKGWVDNKCLYEEKVDLMGIKSVVSCKLSRPQINEIISVTNAYNVISKYSGEQPDLTSIDAAQNNPVARVWMKYLNDSSVCNVSVQTPNN